MEIGNEVDIFIKGNPHNKKYYPNICLAISSFD